MSPTIARLIVFIFVSSIAGAWPFGNYIGIGYRKVHPDQAAAYAAACDTLVWDAKYATGMSSYGEGVYLTKTPDAWKVDGERKHCVIAANTAAFTAAHKVKVPSFAVNDDTDDFENFRDNEALINAYLDDIGADKERDIRVVYDPDGDPQYEIIIPVALLNQNGGGLQIETICRDTVAEIPKPHVIFESTPWRTNMIGSWDPWDIC